MRKNLIRAAVALTLSAGVAVGGAAIAAAQDDTHVGPYPSVQEQQAIWIEGGENAGKGAAQLVSSAVLGVPAAFMDYGQTMGNYGLQFGSEASGAMGAAAPVK